MNRRRRFSGGYMGGGAADVVIARLAHRLYGAGYNSGAAPLTGDGTAKSYAANFVNDSGADMSTLSLVFQGWTLRTTGTTDASASYNVSGTIEFPVGTTVATINTFTVQPGQNLATPTYNPSSPITAGGTFRVSLTATPANGATYISNLGFAGVRNHALASTQRHCAVAGFGDSIMGNNNGSLFNSASGRCGIYLNSISGTTAATYGASSAANFQKQADLAQLLGCTHVMTNFGTNDFGAGTALATLQGYITSMRDLVRTKGMLYTHITMLPRTLTPTPVSCTLTSSGNTITATVADSSIFTVGKPYSIAGATQTEYNNAKICIGVNTGNNTATFHFQGSGTTPATGTITITSWKPTAEAGSWQPVFSGFYTAGGASSRGQFNAWVRAGNMDAYLEWADVVEPSRDAGRWKIADEDALLPNVQLVTVSSVISTTRFNSDYSRGTNTVQNGFLVPLTGGNIGINKTNSTNTNGDITVTSAFGVAQQIGDQYYVTPGVYYMSDDGTHPRVASGGKGAQQILDNATAAWLDSRI